MSEKILPEITNHGVVETGHHRVDHAKASVDKLTNCEILCFVLGWQGGTVHQVALTLGLTACEVLEATPDRMRQLCREAQRRCVKNPA